MTRALPLAAVLLVGLLLAYAPAATSSRRSAVQEDGLVYLSLGDSVSRNFQLFAIDKVSLSIARPEQNDCGITRTIEMTLAGKKIKKVVDISRFEYPERAYPRHLQQILERVFSQSVTLRDLGCSGMTMGDLWDRSTNGPQARLTRAVPKRSEDDDFEGDPDIIGVTLGANEILGPCRRGWPIRVTVEQLRFDCPEETVEDALNDLDETADLVLNYLRQNSLATIIVTLYYYPDESQAKLVNTVDRINRILHRAANGLEDVHIVELPVYFKGHGCRVPATSLPKPLVRWIQRRDCLHPNEEGSRQIAAAMALEAVPALYSMGFDVEEPVLRIAPTCEAFGELRVVSVGWEPGEQVTFRMGLRKVSRQQADEDGVARVAVLLQGPRKLVPLLVSAVGSGGERAFATYSGKCLT